MADYRQLRKEEITKLVPRPAVIGKGLLNTVINNLPVPLHVPGYKYLGPGTHLERNLEKGVKPKNKLDELAMQHDIAYSKSNNLSDRHKADYALQEGAWNRVLAKDAGLGEKGVAWLTTNVMKVKRKLGAGLLTKHLVSLDDEQKAKLAIAVQQEKPITVTVSARRTKDSVMNETYLPLTRSQIKNLKQGKNKIKLSKKQLQKIKTGGFLPALLAAAPVVASVVATLANAYSNKKTNDKLVEERIRHNKEMEKRGGKGVYIYKKPKNTSSGSGIYINKKPSSGGNALLKELLKKKKTLR